MNTSVLLVLSYTILVFNFTTGFTIKTHTETLDIASKSQISLQSTIISCGLTDIVIISAPVVAGRRARYYLTNPKGEIRKLDIASPRYKTSQDQEPSSFETIKVTFVNKTKVITPMNDYKVFNVNYNNYGQTLLYNDTRDIFAEKEDKMEANDFMIGPLSEDDYGNWIVSVVYKDDDDKFTELYKVITLDIIETVPGSPSMKELMVGETFELGFAYPIPGLESCQLIVPRSTFDRFYDRNRAKPDTCGYVVRNVTRADSGRWSIIGVGRVTYHAIVALKVK